MAAAGTIGAALFPSGANAWRVDHGLARLRIASGY